MSRAFAQRKTALLVLFLALVGSNAIAVEAPPAFPPIDPFAAPPPETVPARDGERFAQAFEPNTTMRMTYSYAWFSGDYAVAIQRNTESYNVICVQEYNTFRNELTAGEVCNVVINPERAERVVAIWSRALEQEWPAEDDRRGFDTDLVSFFTLDGEEERFGSAGSPADDSVSALLTQVGVDLTRYCRTTDWPFGLLIR